MEKEKKYTPLLIIEEASRCLLCYDAPCSKACPAKTNPARFIRAVRFRNFKGAVAPKLQSMKFIFLQPLMT